MLTKTRYLEGLKVFIDCLNKIYNLKFSVLIRESGFQPYSLRIYTLPGGGGRYKFIPHPPQGVLFFFIFLD